MYENIYRIYVKTKLFMLNFITVEAFCRSFAGEAFNIRITTNERFLMGWYHPLEVILVSQGGCWFEGIVEREGKLSKAILYKK